MKSKNTHLIITLVLAVLTTYFIVDAIRGAQRDKDAKERIKQSQQAVKGFELLTDSLVVVISQIETRTKLDSIKLDSLKLRNTTISTEIKYTKRVYSDLLKGVPENTRDSLLNYKQREAVLLTVNRNQNKSITNLREQVKVLEVTKVDLQEVIVNKDLIKENDENVRKEMSNTIADLQVRLKESRKGKVKHWLEGGVVGILLAVLLL